MSRTESDEAWLRAAIDLSRQCPKSDSSFAVGAIIVSKHGVEIARGFSLEMGERMHAEEVAIHKALEAHHDLSRATIYSSLEPCSVRLSGKRSCSARIVDSGMARVVFAMREPSTFVDCQGTEQLQQAGIEVVEIPSLAPQVAEINSHLPIDRK